MEEQEEDAPFQERDVEPLEASGAEAPGILHIASREEITGRDEEEGHVEGVDDAREHIWGLRVSDHHEDDGEPLADGDHRIAFSRLALHSHRDATLRRLPRHGLSGQYGLRGLLRSRPSGLLGLVSLYIWIHDFSYYEYSRKITNNPRHRHQYKFPSCRFGYPENLCNFVMQWWKEAP